MQLPIPRRWRYNTLLIYGAALALYGRMLALASFPRPTALALWAFGAALGAWLGLGVLHRAARRRTRRLLPLAAGLSLCSRLRHAPPACAHALLQAALPGALAVLPRRLVRLAAAETLAPRDILQAQQQLHALRQRDAGAQLLLCCTGKADTAALTCAKEIAGLQVLPLGELAAHLGRYALTTPGVLPHPPCPDDVTEAERLRRRAGKEKQRPRGALRLLVCCAALCAWAPHAAFGRWYLLCAALCLALAVPGTLRRLRAL